MHSEILLEKDIIEAQTNDLLLTLCLTLFYCFGRSRTATECVAMTLLALVAYPASTGGGLLPSVP